MEVENKHHKHGSDTYKEVLRLSLDEFKIELLKVIAERPFAAAERRSHYARNAHKAYRNKRQNDDYRKSVYSQSFFLFFSAVFYHYGSSVPNIRFTSS